MKKVVALVFALVPFYFYAQTVITMQNGNSTTCSADFVDTGGSGPGSVYSPNENFTYTICPNNNSYVSIDFVTFNLGLGDIMTIYNGNNTSAPVLAVFDNTSLPSLVSSIPNGNPSGCLTVVFTSDGADEGVGWFGYINCYAPCQGYNVVLDSLSHDTVGNFIDICQGDTLRIWAHGDFFDNNQWYNQHNGNVSFDWYVGDDQDSVINNAMFELPVDTAYGAKILVTAKDSLGCASSNPFELTMRVGTTPSMTNVGLLHDTICFTETNLLSLAAEPVLWTNTDSSFISGTLALPDGSGANPGVYNSDLTFTMFTPGDTVSALTDVIEVWFNAEHSFIGDLSITLKCPNNNSVVLQAYPSTGTNSNWLGEPCDQFPNNLNVPGFGYLYEFPVNIPPTNGTLDATATVVANDFCAPASTGATKPAGTYTPVTSFNNLIGCPLNGTWQLTTVDQWGGDDGTLFGWGINFNPSLYPSTSITYKPGIDTIIVDMDTSIVSTVQVNQDTIEILPHVYDTLLSVSVSVIDSFGCNHDTSYSFYIRPPYDPICCKAVPPITQMIKVGCPGGSDGQIIVDPVDSLGPPPFWYKWYDSSGNLIHQTDSVFVNDTLTGLSIGTYTVEVKDSIGCIVTKDVTVTQVQAMQIVPFGITQTSCATATCDAQATSTVYFGTSPFTYLWSSGETGTQATALCAGNNFLQVVDGRGCIDTAYFNVTTPAPVSATALGDTLICQTKVAPLTGVGSGGTPPYSYTWQGGASTNQVYNPTPGINTLYQVVITDANNCAPDSATVYVRVRPPLNSQILFVDTICPYDTTSIKLIPYGGDSIYSYTWNTGETSQSINVSPNTSQYYHVTLTDACGTNPTKTDSIWVQVGGYPPLTVRTNDDDTVCLGEAYNLIAVASGGDKQYTYEWDHGLGIGQLKSVIPTQTTSYFVTATDQCNTPAGVGKLTVHVGNFENFNVWVDTNQNCDPATFNFAVDTVVPGANYEWNFGNGFTSIFPSDTFDVVLDEDGCHDVTLRVTTELGCVSTKKYDCMVTVLPKPTANFSFDPLNPDVEEPVVNFSGTTGDGEQWLWTINGDTVDNRQYFSHIFADSGQYFINMEVTNAEGCVDSIQKALFVYYTPAVFIPTAFTPNGDGNNETFGIVGEGISDEEFRMEIYNRWGNLVFETNEISEEWNGRWNNTGEVAQNGTYTYVIYYKLYTGLEQVKRGEINIIR